MGVVELVALGVDVLVPVEVGDVGNPLPRCCYVIGELLELVHAQESRGPYMASTC